MRTWRGSAIVIQLAAVAAPAAILSEPLGAERPVASRRTAEGQPASRRVVEIRSYNLKPGTRERFHELFLKEALPMLKRWKVDVIAHGPSLHDQDSYFLMRGSCFHARRDLAPFAKAGTGGESKSLRWVC